MNRQILFYILLSGALGFLVGTILGTAVAPNTIYTNYVEACFSHGMTISCQPKALINMTDICQNLGKTTTPLSQVPKDGGTTAKWATPH